MGNPIAEHRDAKRLMQPLSRYVVELLELGAGSPILRRVVLDSDTMIPWDTHLGWRSHILVLSFCDSEWWR